MAHVVNDWYLTTKYRIDSRPVHVGFVVDKTTRGLIFSPSISVFPCHHSTNAPHASSSLKYYCEKVKRAMPGNIKKRHALSGTWGDTFSYLGAF
jgi:hypothetical protein